MAAPRITQAAGTVPIHHFQGNTMGQLALPIAPATANTRILTPTLKLLPKQMDSGEARVLLLAIALQESKLADRWQVIDRRRPERRGPARGLWQFELGSRASRGGMWGIYLHDASRYWLRVLCEARDVEFAPKAIWSSLEHDDVLAAGAARLLLFTDPHRLPAVGDVMGAWSLYATRCWRPGKPHPDVWPGNYARAVETVG